MSDTDHPPEMAEVPKVRHNGPGPRDHTNLGLTPETRAKVLRLVRAGNYRETAAAACGIHANTLRVWMRRGALFAKHGRPEDEVYAHFNDEMELAEADAETKDSMRIGRAAIDTPVGRGDWRAVAWRLERMHPKKWGYRVRIEVVEELEIFMAKLQRNLPPEIYEQVLNASTADDSPAATSLHLGSSSGESDAHPGSAIVGGSEGASVGEIPE